MMHVGNMQIFPNLVTYPNLCCCYCMCVICATYSTTICWNYLLFEGLSQAEGIHSYPRPTPRNSGRLLEDGVAPEDHHHSHAGQAEGAGESEVPQVLAGERSDEH